MRRLTHIGLAVCFAVATPLDGRAQTAEAEPCAETLLQAEQKYVENAFEDAEALALECTEDGETADVLRTHRLLALALIRQGRVEDAQIAILRILAVDYGYQPDIHLDPPFYVALVETVREQLRVEAAETPPALLTARGTQPIPARRPEVPIATTQHGGGSAARPAAAVDDRVNVNTASAADLQAVRGIGPALAGRIVAYRTDHGAFHSAEDLQQVRGIGPRSVQRLASQLAFGGRVVSPPAGSSEAAAPSQSAAPTGPRLDLNAATADDLEALNGIGPVLAARIVAYRDEVGGFRSVDDLLDVRGIGPRVLARLSDQLTVD